MEIDKTEQKFFEYTLRSLGARDQTSAEIAKKLTKRGASEDLIRRIVDRLTRSGILADQAYAERFIQRRGESRGKRQLAIELRNKGLDPAETLAKRTDEDEVTAATHTLRKRIGTKSIPTDYQDRQKLTGYLARRGFTFAAIRSAWHNVSTNDDLDWLESDDLDEPDRAC